MKKYIVPLIEIKYILFEDILVTSFSFDDLNDLENDPSIDEIF